MDNVKVFVLANGREFLATIKEATDTQYVLTDAVAIGFREEGNNQIGIVPQPLSLLVEHNERAVVKNITVNKHALVFEPAEPTADMLSTYSQIKSPIQVIQSGFVKGQFTRN